MMASPATNVKSIQDAQRSAWRREWPFTIELLSIDWLFADDRYQRPPVEPFIEAKVLEFDPVLVGTIDVSKRANDEFAIMDGLQRSEIVKRVDKRAIWCTVYAGMTLKEEAEFFFSKNRERRNMHPYYALRARAVAGERGPRQILRIVEDCGYKLGSTGGKDPDTIVAIASIEEAHGMTSLPSPTGSLQPALATLRDAFHGRDGANDGNIIRGLCRFWQAFYDNEVDYKHLVAVLEDIGPKKLVGYAVDNATTSRYPKAYLVAAEIVKVYNRAVRKDKKLSAQMLNQAENKKLRERRAAKK